MDYGNGGVGGGDLLMDASINICIIFRSFKAKWKQKKKNQYMYKIQFNGKYNLNAECWMQYVYLAHSIKQK